MQTQAFVRSFALVLTVLFALDAASGKQLWVTETTPPGSFNICTGAPRTMNGKVIIGNGGKPAVRVSGNEYPLRWEGETPPVAGDTVRIVSVEAITVCVAPVSKESVSK